MKLATVTSDGRKVLAALLPDGKLVDISGALQMNEAASAAASAGDMLALIRSGTLPAISAQTLAEQTEIPAAAVQWLPPIEQPGKICCVAINNRAFDKARISGPEHPAFFLKSPTSLIGHEGDILLKEEYGLTHPEPELAVVIGDRLTEATALESMSAIFGYTILNDITSIRMRNEDHFHFNFDIPDGDGGFKVIEQHTSYAGRYKSADTFGPLGPVISTPDEIGDPNSLAMRCWLDDELVMSDNSASYRYGVADVLSFISHYETLLPGDIVTLGTAVSGGSRDRPLASLDLREGVRNVRLEIEGIGILSNSVRIRS